MQKPRACYWLIGDGVRTNSPESSQSQDLEPKGEDNRSVWPLRRWDNTGRGHSNTQEFDSTVKTSAGSKAPEPPRA